MSPRVIKGRSELESLVGAVIGRSDYLDVTQERVNLFADATGDHQWIHVDVERAKAGPFGAPIGHGYLTLSLAGVLYPQVVAIEGFAMAINYGANRVRFPSPVVVNSRLRLVLRLLAVDDIGGGVQATMEFTFECEGAAKPCCVAEVLMRYYR